MWGKSPLLRSGDRGWRIDRALLLESHQRCEQAGVPRDRETLSPTVDPGAIDPRLQRPALLAFARTLFRDTAEYIAGARPLFMITDAHARVVLVLPGDTDGEQAVQQRGLDIGASLAEQDAGTTASSLAVRLRGPAVINGDEHFCHAFRDWCCIAVPVNDGNGGLLGSLDLSVHDHDCEVGEKLAVAYSLSRALTEFDRSSASLGASALVVQLTDRQQQVLKLFAEGLSYKQIAKQLNVTSRKTIEDHLDAIRAKLGAASRRECIRRAIDLGLL